MKYFTIKELSASSVAMKNGIDNTPDPYAIDNLHELVDNILDPARERLGEPIYINSGFRNEEVNRLVGGAKKSQHMSGMAADCYCTHNDKLLSILLDLDFDQIVIYPGFIHVSYTTFRRNRNQVIDKRQSL